MQRNRFAVKKTRIDKNAEGTIISREFACDRAGVYKPRGNNERKHESKKVGCTWGVRASFIRELQMYRLVSVNLKHKNHPQMDPGQFRLETSSRFLPPEVLQLIQTLFEAKLEPAAIFQTVKKAVDVVTFIKKDVDNEVARLRGVAPRAEQASALVSFVRIYTETTTGAGSYFSTHVDSRTLKLERAFFMDSSQRTLARKFSDVILLDSTYKTNSLMMPLCVIAGVDQEGRNIILAGALLVQETAAAYSWILSQFLLATRASPAVILTDEDPSIAKAVRDTMPTTQHSLCTWHLNRNIVENLSKTLSDSLYEFMGLFREAAEAVSLESFEVKWTSLKSLVSESRTNYVERLYSSRSKWARHLTGHYFSAGLCSTQRVEAINSVLKMDLGVKTTLQEVAERFLIQEPRKYDEIATLQSLRNMKGVVRSGDSAFDPSAHLMRKISSFAMKLFDNQLVTSRGRAWCP